MHSDLLDSSSAHFLSAPIDQKSTIASAFDVSPPIELQESIRVKGSLEY